MSTTTFRIARTLWAGLFPLYWIEALNLLPPDFTIVDVEEYDQTLDLLAAGEIDGNFQSLADLLLMVGRGVDLRLLMASDLSSGVDGVVCRPGITTVQDLAGKRLALSLLSYPHVLIQQILAMHGMTEADVVLVDLRGERVPDALQRGEIDAGHTWGVHIEQARQQGAQLLFSSNVFPGLLVDCLVARPETVARAPASWVAFIQAHDHALAWWRDNEEAGYRIVAERSALSIAEVRAMLTNFTLYTVESARPLFARDATQPPALYASGRLFSRFYQEKGLLSRAPDLEQIITPLVD
jgi:ABC-type nitrate/sulfonate/bicarbonate transport system substrate-binding protein